MKKPTILLGLGMALTVLVAAMAVLLGPSQPTSAAAPPTNWTDWTAATAGQSGSASGTLAGGTVSYTGEVSGFQINGGTFNFWTPPTPWISATVKNAPPDPAGDAITMRFPTTNTLTFSPPVKDPVMAIFSLGGAVAVDFTFDRPFVILSSDGGLTNPSGNILRGAVSINLGSGTIQFSGTVSSITWTGSAFENFHAFQVGVPKQPPTPTATLTDTPTSTQTATAAPTSTPTPSGPQPLGGSGVFPDAPGAGGSSGPGVVWAIVASASAIALASTAWLTRRRLARRS